MRCKYLDNQVCVRSDGQYRLCCVSLEGNNKETVHTHTPQEWYDGEFHSKVTEQMENDIWPEACVRCEKQEEQGIDSMRTRVKPDGTRYVRNFYGPGISHLDIRFGNSCNLKCISCWEMSSSSIAEEAIEMKKAGIQPLHGVLEIPNFNWASEETMKRFDNLPIREVYLTGGEPMMVKHLDKFLNRLDPKVVVRFNTNGTLWNPKIEKILRRFDVVIMSLSLDAASDKIDYIRYGSKWNEIEVNAQKYADFCRVVDVTPTISLLNILYYDEITEYARKNNFKLYDNLLILPEWLHVKNAPQSLKDQFHGIHPDVDGWANHPADPLVIEHFVREITKQDKWRGMYIKDYLPEVAAAYGLS